MKDTECLGRARIAVKAKKLHNFNLTTAEKFEKEIIIFRYNAKMYSFSVYRNGKCCCMLSPEMVVFLCNTKRFWARIETSKLSSSIFKETRLL